MTVDAKSPTRQAPTLSAGFEFLSSLAAARVGGLAQPSIGASSAMRAYLFGLSARVTRVHGVGRGRASSDLACPTPATTSQSPAQSPSQAEEVRQCVCRVSVDALMVWLLAARFLCAAVGELLRRGGECSCVCSLCG